MNCLLTQIDENSIRDHSWLTPNDKCYFFGEYTPRKGWGFSDMNNLISNFKKPMCRREKADEWHHKKTAIKTVANLFVGVMGKIPNINNVIFVPVPPSSIVGDPNYDPRMVQALEIASNKLQVEPNIRECITQTKNTEPDHKRNSPRSNPRERAKIYRLHTSMISTDIKYAVIVDDLITTGSHYKAMELKIQDKFPHIEVMGLFIARRVPDHSSAEEDFNSVV